MTGSWYDPIKLLGSLIGVLLGIGVMVYIWLQAVGSVGSDIETETAGLVTVNTSVDANAYIFRDETVMGKNISGTVVTVVSDGDRVSKGQLVANIYPGYTESLLQDELNRINRKISILEESTVDSGYVITDLSRLDEEIGDIFSDIYVDGAKGNISDAIDNSAELLVNLNKRDIIVDSERDFSTEKEQLLAQRREIEAKINSESQSVYAVSSGYFYSGVDGYEEIFSTDKIDTLTLEELSELSEASPASGGAIKLINDIVWYTACEIPSEKCAVLEIGDSYTLLFPENGNQKISMKLVRKIEKNTSPYSAVVFRANVMPVSFNYKRSQDAKIILDTTEGLTVPKKALRKLNGENGVYILVGDVVHYRSVEIIDETDNYYIVDTGENAKAFEEAEDKKTQTKPLSLYDNVIVSGKELFDGKIVG